MDFENLLHTLKENTPQPFDSSNVKEADIRFAIVMEGNEPFVEIRNAANRPATPDYRMCGGEIGGLIRTINNIRTRQLDTISWEKQSDRVSLRENAFLVFQLLHFPLINAEGKELKVENEVADLALVIEPNGKNLKSHFRLTLNDGNEKKLEDLVFLNNAYAMSGQQVLAIPNVGFNFQSLPYFESSFSPSQAETFLSLFYSYFPTDIRLEWGDAEMHVSPETLEAKTAIVFEKVDEEQTLYLRVAAAIPGSEDAMMPDTPLRSQVTLQENGHLTLHNVIYPNIKEETHKLVDLITKCYDKKRSTSEIYVDDNFVLVPEELASPFLMKALPMLLQRYTLLGADKLHKYKLKAVRPSLNVTTGSGIDFLECKAKVQLGDEEFSLRDILRQFEKQRYVNLSTGDRALIDEKYIRRLNRIFRKGKGQDDYEVSFFDLAELEGLLDAPSNAEPFVKHRAVYEGFNKLSSQKMRFPQVKAELRSYQREGVKWMNYLYENNLGGCLADDMGLGKTLQTISMLARIYPEQKESSLIVMPRSLIFNWQAELKRFAPQLTVYTFYGPTRDLEEARKHHLILTTYAMVRNNVELFKDAHFHYVVLDESQNIKNVTAQSTQAVYLLKADHRLALSGTPIENNLTELYSLFRFLNPAMFGSLSDFNATYTTPIQKQGDAETMDALRRKIFPFMLRRLKKDVLKELPDRIEQTLYVEMEPDQAEFYERRRAYYQDLLRNNIRKEGLQKSQFLMFQALGELRRIASVPESFADSDVTSPKLNPLMDSLTDAVAGGHKAVVFFNYIAGIELVGEALEKEGISYATMTGATHDRKSIVERFQNDRSLKVLLMTLKTGGVGLNLTAADMVYIFEPWWNKAAEEQAINRLHRFGQKSTVLSYSLITRDTIEEKIQQLQQQKADLFEGLITHDSSMTKVLTEEDINFILG